MSLFGKACNTQRTDYDARSCERWHKTSRTRSRKGFLAATIFALTISMLAASASAMATGKVTLSDSTDPVAGQFMVAVAASDGSYILEPTFVDYKDNQTAQEALESSPYDFVFSGSTLVSVKDQKELFNYYHNVGNKTDMLSGIDASEVTSLAISANESAGYLGDGHIALLDALSRYQKGSKGLHNYPDAQNASKAAQVGFPTVTQESAATLADNLNNAIDKYEDYINGQTYAVNFSVTKGGVASTADITLTDIYGNETKAVNGKAEVVAGTYTYEALDSAGTNGVRCTKFVVDDSTPSNTVAIALPESNWFGSIDLRINQANKANCSILSGSAAGRDVTYAVPDATKSTTDLFVYAQASDEVKKDTNYKNTYKLYALYTGANGKDYTEASTDNQIAFESESFAPQYMVDQNLEENNIRFEITHELTSSSTDGTIYQVEICNATLTRSPTLGSISAIGDNLETVSGFAPFVDTYDVKTSSSTLAVKPQGFVSDGAYSYTVAGKTYAAGDVINVDIPTSAYNTPYQIPIVVSLSNGLQKTYMLKVTLCDPSSVTLTHSSNVSVQVYNSAGSEVFASSGGGAGATSTTFMLLDGESYAYVATKDTYYHSKEDFVAKSGAAVNVATPHDSNIVSELNLGRKSTFKDDGVAYDKVSDTNHELVFSVPDVDFSSWLLVIPQDSDNGVRVSASYSSQRSGDAMTFEDASDYKTGHTYYNTQYILSSLDYFLRTGGYSNTATLQIYEGASAPASGAEYYQDYKISAHRTLTLSSLGVSCDSATVSMVQTSSAQSQEPITRFDKNVLDYTVGVPQGTTSLNVRYMFTQPVNLGEVTQGGYQGTLAGVTQDYSTGLIKQTIELDPTHEQQVFNLKVTHNDATSTEQTYTIRVNQLPSATVTFDVTPSDASVGIIENISGARVDANSDGTFTLINSYKYSYTVACSGYKGISGELTASDGLKITQTLEKAEDNPDIDPTIEAQWPLFRADSNNNSVISAKTPTSADDTLLYWATQVGQGYDKNATGCPILVDGYLYTYAGDKIYKLDTISGEVVASGTMTGTSSFAITPMTYAQGMVFVALSNGRVQAFNADTLESLWVYQSSNGGQPNSPISYADGKIYTGFWNKSSGDSAAYGDFVCLTITDEDPSQTKENKVALWEYNNNGGFYWAGSYACDNFVVVGSDNGSIDAVLDMSGEDAYSGTLYSFDTKTGKVIDSITSYPGDINIGNIRSTPVYDPDTSRMYWVGRGGYFCSAKIGSDGVFDKSSITVLRLENNSKTGQLSSTATPVIYNGRAYAGADAGSSYGDVGSGHCVDVIDLATNTIAYKVAVGGRPQASSVCTNAYVDSEGYAYIYFVDNYTPGKVRYIKDKPGQTSAITSTIETGTDKQQYNVADVLFCPAQAQQQYCICSPIVDEYGTIYIKNDSAYMMAIGSTIEKVEITTPPDRTSYELGETFDPAGMKVTATYSNGTTRDITDYVEYQTEAFEITGKQTLEVKFPYTMYQNSTTDGQIGTAPNYNFNCPTATLELNVVDSLPPQITTNSLPDALATSSIDTNPQSYSAQLEAIGTTGECKWSFEGALPQGISFDGSTATLSGVAAQGSGGTYDLRFTLTNSQGTTSKTLTLTVNERPSVVSGALEAGMVGVSYSQKLELERGYPAEDIEWKITGGYLPYGLTLNSQTGVISGTPRFYANYNFVVTATNSVGQSVGSRVSILINEYTCPAAISTSNVDSAEVGKSYSKTFSATGKPAEFSWSFDGQLPNGMQFNADSATLSGTPAAGSGGVYQFTLSVTNGVGSASTKSYILHVNEDPQISDSSMPSAAKGFEYWHQIGFIGYPNDFEWSISSGALPDGLALDAATGIISGTPTQTGNYQFVVRVASASSGKSDTKSFELSVGTTSPAVITTQSLPDAQVGAADAYSCKLQATGAPTSFEWTCKGTLPDGITFDASTATLLGKPAVGSGGVYELEFSADNGSGKDTKSMSLVVNEDPTLLTTSLASGFVGDNYKQEIEVVGYPKVDVTVEGLPDGLSFDSSTLTISGTPKASGTSSVKIALTSELGSLEQDMELSVKDIKRLSGGVRYDTMEEIVKASFDEDRSCRYLIVSSGDNFPDALSASALAGIYDAPVIITSTGSLSDQAKTQIKRLSRGDTIVFVTGGNAAVSDSVFNEIKSISGVYDVQRLAGIGRVETGLEIYKQGKGSWGDTCVISSVTNYADALSIGTYCANNSAPIFGTVGGVLTDDQISEIKSAGFNKIVITGGDAAVNEASVKSSLGYDKQYVVLAGDTRLQTSQKIVNWECGFDTSYAFMPQNILSVDNIALTNANGFADALAGVTLSLRYNSAILLVNDDTYSYSSIQDVVGNNKDSIVQGWILGGSAAVSPDIESWFGKQLKD